MSDNQNPEAVLSEIADRVKRIESLVKNDQELRIDLESANNALTALEELNRRDTIQAKDLDHMCSSSTRTLSKLYYAGYVNRRGDPYRYQLTEKGRLALQDAHGAEQSELPEASEETSNPDPEPEPDPDPWEDTELNESEYVALRCVDDHDGHPRSKDINEDFCSHGYKLGQQSVAVAARLSELYKKGHVDRPADLPYRYWLTEKGKEALE